MTRDERATAADLARLRAEISADRSAMSRCVADVELALASWRDAPPERPLLVLAAVGLHGWYTGLEAVLERVGRTLDGSVPRGETWHRDLLSQGFVEVPGVRPPVLPEAVRRSLLALLAFRHFFRHAYAVELDPARLRVEIERLQGAAPGVDAALDDFDAFLASALTSLTGSG